MENDHRIVVTGAGGFVGKHLCARLENQPNTKVFSLGHADDGTSIDIRDETAVQKFIKSTQPTSIIHLAAIASPADASFNPNEAWDVNFSATVSLAHSLQKEAPDASLIFGSTSECYGTSLRDSSAPILEIAPLHPTSVYGATKACADIALEQLSHQGLRCVRFRAFNHTGPGQIDRYVVPAFASQIARIEAGLSEPKMSVGNLDAQRDFLHVSDVVEAYTLAATTDISPDSKHVYNLSCGKPVSIRYILDFLLDQCALQIDVAMDPDLARPSEIPVASGNPSKVKSAFDWNADTDIELILLSVLNDWRVRISTETR